MTSRERVLSVFNGEIPDRVPMWCGASSEFRRKARRELKIADDESLSIRFHDDFRRVHARYCGPKFDLSKGAVGRSVFGIEHHGIGCGQPDRHPLAEAVLSEIHGYKWPDPAWWDVSRISADAKAWNRQYAILGGDWSPFWHDAIDLMGMEELLVRMYTDPEAVHALLEHIVDYYFEVSRIIFDAAASDIDIFFIGNDLGSQTGPLLGEELFNAFLLPHFRRLADLGHEYGLKVQLHCCGGISQLLPSIIESGIDAVHAVQTTCAGMDLRKLKEDFGGKLVFNGGIDSHHVLIDGSPKIVAENTREVLSIMMPGGGYVAGASHDWILEETPVNNVVTMLDTVLEYGKYS